MLLPEGIRNYHRGRVIAFVGMPGSGKSEDLAQFIAHSRAPGLYLDTVGALTKKLSGQDDRCPIKHSADVWLVEVEKGFDLDDLWDKTADWLNDGERVVWNLGGWMPEEIQELCEALVPRLMRARDIIFGIDEVQRAMPDFSSDNGRGSPRMKDWVTKRRNDGITFVWTSQRPAFVSMTVRGVTDAWVFHRLWYVNDVEVVAKLLQRHPNVDAITAEIGNLGPGEVYFVDLPFMA